MTSMAIAAAISTLASVGVGIQASSTDPVSARLRVEPVERTFATARDVSVWVVVENSGQHCKAVMLGQALAAFPSTSRPYTFLTFEIRDSQDRVVKMEHRHFGLQARFEPADLLALRCVSLHGWGIPLGVGPWTHSLGPGKYTLRAQLRNDVSSFFASNPDQLQRLSSATGIDRQHLKKLLIDFSIEAAEVSFEVAAPTQ